MKVLVLSTQATGASIFAAFLGQGKKTAVMMDCFMEKVLDKVPPEVEHVVVKQNFHPYDLISIEDRVQSFKPDHVIVMVRHPADIWTSLQTRAFRDFGGSPEEKILMLEKVIAEGKYTVLRYEDFVGSRSLFLLALKGCLPGFQVSDLFYNMSRPLQEILDFNMQAGFEWWKDYATGGTRYGKIESTTPRPVPKEVMTWLSRNCPTLMGLYEKEARVLTAAHPRRKKFTFHYVAAVHVPVSREYSACAYTQKIHKLTRMLLSQGHKVYLYGTERTDISHPNLEFVKVLPISDVREQWGDKDCKDPNNELGYEWRKEYFRHDLGMGVTAPVRVKFLQQATVEIRKRMEQDHFLLLPLGGYQKPIADELKVPLTVEPGVGYTGVIGPFIAYESAFVQNWISGHTTRGDIPDGRRYDRVIPNYFDVADFPFVEKPDGYFIYMGRMIERKGWRTAYHVAKAFGIPLKMVGQGKLPDEILKDPLVQYQPAVSPKERAELLGHAMVSFVPTVYMEPFGGVSVEAMMCGTPVMTTDFGAFPEINKNGVSGYRCNTFSDFVARTADAIKLDRSKVREYAIRNYSMDAVGGMFEDWWKALYSWHLGNVGYEGGWWSLSRKDQWKMSQVNEYMRRRQKANIDADLAKHSQLLKIMEIEKDYPGLDLKGKRVLDVGGGHTSLLLKCRNFQGMVLDPGFSFDSTNPYEGTDIRWKAEMCEEMEEKGWDEVWVSSVIRGVFDPAEAASRILKAGKVIRVCEPISTAKNHNVWTTMSDCRLLYRSLGASVSVPWQECSEVYVTKTSGR